MEVLFDATWIGKWYETDRMHGGLRVAIELAKRLPNTGIDVHYANLDPTFSAEYRNRLVQFVQNETNYSSNHIVDYNPALLKILSPFILNKTPKEKKIWVKKWFPFKIPASKLSTFEVFHTPADPIPDYIKGIKHIRTFLTAHDLIPLIKPEYDFKGYGVLLRKIYSSIDHNTTVLCVSNSTRNDLLNYRPDINPDSVRVIYIAADKNQFYQIQDSKEHALVRQKYNIPYQQYFLSINAFAKYKNTQHIIESYLEYKKNRPNDEIGLVFIGQPRDPGEKQRLYDKYNGLQGITFLPYVADEDMATLYSQAIAFLYMSLYEGFGLPVLEAMQCGTPVICSNTSSIPEVVGDAGISLEPNDIDAMVHAMIQVSNDSSLSNELSVKGLERAELFSWDRYAKEVAQAYKTR